MDGFINFFKDTGITSNKALERIRKITGCKKSGFLGTLDPVASGILPVGLGKGTKLFQYFEKVPKKYRSRIVFGGETDTQDSTGAVVKNAAVEGVTEERLEETLEKFKGEIMQIPPMYSAKKINGQRLYRIARKGGDVKREGKKVMVHSIELNEFAGDSAVFTAVVSQGTYIRTLCEDIGREIGCLAHMGGLTREQVHVFLAESSITLEQIDELKDDPEKWLLPMDFPVSHLPNMDVSLREYSDLSSGLPIKWNGKEGFKVRLYGPEGNFFGMGRTDPVKQKTFPEKVLFPYSASAGKSDQPRRPVKIG
ncbi:MAG: tRNA pseudouridine(55) synthase TruB [Nitrospinota bacterium]